MFSADATVDGRLDLFARRVDGGGTLVPLGDAAQHGTTYTHFSSAGDEVFYLAETAGGSQLELFATSLSDPATVRPLGISSPRGEAQFSDFHFSDDQQWFFYGADFDTDHRYSAIMAIATDGSTGPFDLVSIPFVADNTGYTVTGGRAGRVVGTDDTYLFEGYGSTTSALYSVPVRPPLAGDFNNDGTVDAADYVVWRKNENTMNTLPNDPDGGMVGRAQYNTWQANFGNVAGEGGITTTGLPLTAVPEPATPVLLLVGVLATFSAEARRCLNSSVGDRCRKSTVKKRFRGDNPADSDDRQQRLRRASLNSSMR